MEFEIDQGQEPRFTARLAEKRVCIVIPRSNPVILATRLLSYERTPMPDIKKTAEPGFLGNGINGKGRAARKQERADP
jgi:hypothetical protein